MHKNIYYKLTLSSLIFVMAMPLFAKDIILSLKPDKNKTYYYCVQTKMIVSSMYRGNVSMLAVSSFKPERISDDEIAITEKVVELNIYNNSTQQFSLGMLLEPYDEETVLQNFLNRNTLTRIINNRGEVVKPYDLSQLFRHKEIDDDSDELMFLDAFNKNDMFTYLERPLKEGYSYVDSKMMRLAIANDNTDSVLVDMKYEVFKITDDETYMNFSSSVVIDLTRTGRDTVKTNGVIVIENSTGMPLQMRQTVFTEDAKVVVFLNRDDVVIPSIEALDGSFHANEYYANEYFPYESMTGGLKFYESEEQISKTLDSLGVMVVTRDRSYGRVELIMVSQEGFVGYGEIVINSIKAHYCNKEVRELMGYKNSNTERLLPFGSGLNTEVPNSGAGNDFPVEYFEVDLSYYMPLGTKEITLTPSDVNKHIEVMHGDVVISYWDGNKVIISGGAYANFYDAKGNEITSGKYKILDKNLSEVALTLNKKVSDVTEEEWFLYSGIDGSKVTSFQYQYELSADVSEIKLVVPEEEYVVNKKLRSMDRDEARASFQAKEKKNNKNKDDKRKNHVTSGKDLMEQYENSNEEFVEIEEVIYEEEMMPISRNAIPPPPTPSSEDYEDDIIEETVEEEQVFIIVENMPQFPGGELAMRTYIAENVVYPEEAKDINVQGRVYASFVIDESGKVTKAKIVRGVHPLLDNEALRVVESMPDWMPGTQRGKPVNVRYTVPISFNIQ